MEKLFIRHGFSEANNRENIGTLAFASEDAKLEKLGIEQARALNPILSAPPYNLDIPNTPAATSGFVRTQQTAHEAGFVTVRHYPLLNEIKHGMDLLELKEMLANNEIPETAERAIGTILENLPEERVIFTHGLVIAALTKKRGGNYERLVPHFCEVRKFDVSQ